jgi:hypothetical protein
MLYIQGDEDEDDDPYQIYEKTTAVDYTGWAFREDPSIAVPLQEQTTLPSQVVTLATAPGGMGKRSHGFGAGKMFDCPLFLFLAAKRGLVCFAEERACVSEKS